MIDQISEHEELADLAATAPNAPIAPLQGIAAIALSMALKYHDINTVQDGMLYQQYKLEGRNLRTLDLAYVFDTAIQIEQHLMGASERIAKMVVEAITFAVDDEPSSGAPDAAP